ncbi:MAG: hypothetical protein Q7T82_09695 [Armatimonadota bacterium]|nr:hypothetical protein [Armatimonadota bacterium]
MSRVAYLVACAVCLSFTITYAADTPKPFDVELLGDKASVRPVISGSAGLITDGPGGKPGFVVTGAQYGLRITEPVFVDSETTVSWWWRKPEGRICALQLTLQNPQTGAMRYLGYGAGSISESLSPDPTVEIFVSDAIPTEWTNVKRDLLADIKSVLGWGSAKVTEVYFSPWDDKPAQYARAGISNALPADAGGNADLAFLESIGKGNYAPPKLKKTGEQRELKYDASFEETAPGRNSAANEWSAFGWPGNQAFNNIGRDLRVRYPAYDLVFRLYDGDKEIAPDSLDSFRLGLVRGNLPDITAGWEYEGLHYRISVVAVGFGDREAYDLYKIDVSNPTGEARESKLAVGLDGPPDMRIDGDLITGLNGAPFALVDKPENTNLITRDWGLCDKRAKSYNTGGGPGQTEEAVATTRIGMDGPPVVYRVKVDKSRSYTVYIVASPHISRLLQYPKKSGDLVFQYEVEGCAPQTLDWIDYIGKKSQPLCVGFTGAHDTDGDGYIQVSSGIAPNSLFKHTRLSVIYVFPDDVKVNDVSQVYSGSMNAQCVQRVDVGVTPEVGWGNQVYDMSDVGLCRLNAFYGGKLNAGESKTYWLKVPPIYRRQPVSMGSYSHAFLQVLPGDAVPPFGPDQIARLRAADPKKDWDRVVNYWDKFYARMARIDTPDPVLKDVYLSRLSTRHILDVKIVDKVWWNACSPWFYYDFAYRDQAYVVRAYDMAGLHDLAERLLNVYCMDVKNVPKGPISFAEVPLQLGMEPDGLWHTRPGQFDTQGQNIWCLATHYKLSGDRTWLRKTAYPYIRRGAMWIVNSRRKHMAEVKDPKDPRYGLIQPGAMEVAAVTRGMHMYYMNAWAILGLREAADVAESLGLKQDQQLFASQAVDLKACLHKSCEKTFRRNGLYQGILWYGVEEEGDGMYGMWGQTPLVWPTRALDPHDPMLTATWRNIERTSNENGGGIFSEGPGGCWPYIGVDWAISYILRGEPEKTLDYFCAFTDTAGLTYSWGEAYETGRNFSMGDQPHFWADAQWVSLYRHLFVLEDGGTLMLTPATMRRWQQGGKGIALKKLPTQFGDLDLSVKPNQTGSKIVYTFKLTPKGDQASRALDRIVIGARTAQGRPLTRARLNGKRLYSFTADTVVVPNPRRGVTYRLELSCAGR